MTPRTLTLTLDGRTHTLDLDKLDQIASAIAQGPGDSLDAKLGAAFAGAPMLGSMDTPPLEIAGPGDAPPIPPSGE